MAAPTPILTSALRGLRRRCPRCGQGRLYKSFFKEHEACQSCGAAFDWYSGEVLGFLYISTAAVTGFFVIAMLIWNPANLWVGRAVIVSLALVAYVVTTPFRKGAALGVKMAIDQRTG